MGKQKPSIWRHSSVICILISGLAATSVLVAESANAASDDAGNNLILEEIF